MPYTKEHKQKSREQILDSASRLFAQRGYEAVSIDDLMKDAGLTRGGFYNHFKNKPDVYAEAIIHAALKSPIAQAYDGTSLESLYQLLDGYLSPEHVDNTKRPCPLAFLVTDVSTREPKVRSTYTRVYENFVGAIGKRLADTDRQDKTQVVLAVTALMIGGVAIGRALNDPATTNALLKSCRTVAKRLLHAS